MLQLQVRRYCRPFRQPLHTAHGLWLQREGLILRFEHEQGGISFGEIAPIPWFDTETLTQAQDFCDRWPRRFPIAQIDTIPDSLPTCQFAFGAAREPSASGLSVLGADSRQSLLSRDICALLPAGAAALQHWQEPWQRGHRTFKWKIGVAAVEEELSVFQKLVAAVPRTLRLRLDANGGLTAEVAVSWLAACDRAPITVEFIEQPLPPDLILQWLPQVQKRFMTRIALDESVATHQQLQQVYQQVGDRVVYVVKPAIAGDPQRLLDFCLQHRLDVVFSSALETPVGRHLAWQLAQRSWIGGIPQRALGFGVDHCFSDRWATLPKEEIWAQL